ncbi:MAG: MBL fold metallo-hydrolase [Candidatus Hermodarchaeota archaeon]
MTIKITWLGTASYILTLNGVKLLFDPFFSRNEDATPILKTKKEDIQKVLAIFISHGHYDHVCDAGWFAENLDIPVYCSQIAKQNIINWAEGKIIENHTESLSEKARENIKISNFYDRIDISKDIFVEIIKSEHINFDPKTILSRLFSWQFLKQAKALLPYGKGFPAGDVFGFCIFFKDIKIVSYGSLWHKYTEELQKYHPCDLFLVPYAGNSKTHMVKKTGKMVEILQPKIVIPIHWDNFMPPISRIEDLEPLLVFMAKKFPKIEVIVPQFDKEITINL